MQLPSSPTSSPTPGVMPFVIGRPLRATEPIFGRDDAFRFINAALASFSSVNIVGERRMGKTSLLAHLRDNPRYTPAAPLGQPPLVLAFLDLQDDITNAARFYGKAMQILLALLPAGYTISSDMANLQQRLTTLPELNVIEFDRALGQLADTQMNAVQPVLVLDESERLMELAEKGQLAYPDFFNHLRAKITAGHLAMLVASRRPLVEYFSDPKRPGSLTSTFPSYFQPLILRELDGSAADSLLLQPSDHILTLSQVTEARGWAKDHPCRLQVAGAAIYMAKRDGRDLAWARARREELAMQVCSTSLTSGAVLPQGPGQQAWRVTSAIVWGGPLQLGRVAQWLGNNFSNVAGWILGVIVIICLVLVIFGYAEIQDLFKIMLKAIGLGG